MSRMLQKREFDATEAGPVVIASSINTDVETKGKNEDHQQNEGHQRIRGQVTLFKIRKQSAADAF